MHTVRTTSTTHHSPHTHTPTTTTTRVAVQTRGLVVHRFVSWSVCHRVNLLGLPILMATPADCPHEGGMRRREGARARRERRQRAEPRLRLRLVRDAAMLVAHRGGPRLDSQSKFVKEGAVPEPVLVSRLLEPSSGVVGPFKHLRVAAQSPEAGAAPLLGDVFWDQPLSLEKLKDLWPSPVSVPATVPVVAASVPSSVLDQQCNVEESGDVSWPQDRREWYRARLSVPPCLDLSRFSQPAVSSSTVAGPSVSVSSSPPRQSSPATRFGTSGFRPMKVCLHLCNGICYHGEHCSFAHSSLETPP